MRATVYRDAEYGALVVIPLGEGVLTIDYDFAPRDYDAALASLERMGVPRETPEGTVWRMRERPEVVAANLDAAMRAQGYTSDALDERAILEMDPDVARRLDLPAAGASGFVVPESVDRGLRAHAVQALAAFAPPAAPPAIHFYPRPRATDEYREPLPFVRARALVRHAEPGNLAGARRRLREALAPVRGCLVRATVAAPAPDRWAIEFAFAPPAAAVRALRERAVPVFAPVEPVGAREVRFLLNALMSEAAATDLAGRAVAGTAVASLVRPSPRVVVARVIAGREGTSLADDAFQERLTWLMRTMEAWDPSLEDIGPVGALMAERLSDGDAYDEIAAVAGEGTVVGRGGQRGNPPDLELLKIRLSDGTWWFYDIDRARGGIQVYASEEEARSLGGWKVVSRR